MKAILKFTAALAVLSATTLPLFAQDAASENVTVFSPYVVKKSTTGIGKNRVTKVTVSRAVSFADLNLASDDGRAALESRVQQVAGDVCKELDRRYPPATYFPELDTKACVKDAIAVAMIQVRDVEKAAQRG